MARTGIDQKSGLASDFLNQFNEISMLLDMCIDDVEVLEDLSGWSPRGYVEHFESSNLRDSALVLEAYRLSPDETRAHFDALTAELAALVSSGLASLRQMNINRQAAELASKTLAADVRARIETLSAVIHPSAPAPRNDDISALFAARR